MADIHKNPQDVVDLSLLLESYGENIGTFYPQAIVYDPNNAEISGSPFTLTLLGNNLYINNGAFQVGDSGTYKIIYLVYTDSGHTVRSANLSERHDTITVSIQSTTGLGGMIGDVVFDDKKLIELIKETEKKLLEKIANIQEEVDNGFKIEVPELDSVKRSIDNLKNYYQPTDIGGLTSSLDSVNKKLDTINVDFISFKDGFLPYANIKRKFDDIITQIKKNRSTTIKSKFDKSLFIPLTENILDLNVKINKEMEQARTSMVKNIDYKTDVIAKSIEKQINEKLDNNYKQIFELLNELNEQMRIKLKAAAEFIGGTIFKSLKPPSKFKK